MVGSKKLIRQIASPCRVVVAWLLFMGLVVFRCSSEEISFPLSCDKHGYIFYNGLPFHGYYDYSFENDLVAYDKFFRSYYYGNDDKEYPTSDEVILSIFGQCKTNDGSFYGLYADGRSARTRFDGLIDPEYGFDKRRASFLSPSNDKLDSGPDYVFTNGLTASIEHLKEVSIPDESKAIVWHESMARLLEEYAKREEPYFGLFLMNPVEKDAFEIHAYSIAEENSVLFVIVTPKLEADEKIDPGLEGHSGIAFVLDEREKVVSIRFGYVSIVSFLRVNGQSLVLHYWERPGSCECTPAYLRTIFYRDKDTGIWYSNIGGNTLPLVGM